jgi:hypothetical protein
MKNVFTKLLPISLFALGLTGSALAQNSCNLIANGDFDQQLAVPASAAGNVKSPFNPTGDVVSWEATNYSTPDYYATNAPAGSAANPNSTIWGPFNPLPGPNAINGCIGVYSYDTGLFGTERYTEYVAQRVGVQLEANMEYYATLQAYKAHASPNASFGTYVGLDLVSSTSPIDYAYTSSTGGYSPRMYTPGRFGVHALVNSSQWTPISGIIRPDVTGTYYVNVGNFQQSNPPASTQDTEVYHYIDAVGLYRIPTAGQPQTTCPNTAVTIGSSCTIPGASYAWSIAGTAVTFPNSPQLRVQPTATTTYSLTVTLPNQVTRNSSVTVTVAPAPDPIVYAIGVDKCAKLATYRIMNYNPAYTYTVTPSSGLYLQQSNPVPGTFSIQGASNYTGGNFSLTRSGCGSSTTYTYVDFTPPSPSGYYTSGYSSSNPNNTLGTTQFFNITNREGADIGMFLTNTPYTFTFSSDLAGLYLTNTSGTATHFILKPGQGTTITATAINSPCPVVGRFAFIASSGGYTYSVAPNPVSDELSVAAAEPDAITAQPFVAELYDRFGQSVKSQASKQSRTVFDVRNLPAGLYHLRIGKGNTAVSQSIWVTH